MDPDEIRRMIRGEGKHPRSLGASMRTPDGTGHLIQVELSEDLMVALLWLVKQDPEGTFDRVIRSLIREDYERKRAGRD